MIAIWPMHVLAVCTYLPAVRELMHDVLNLAAPAGINLYWHQAVLKSCMHAYKLAQVPPVTARTRKWDEGIRVATEANQPAILCSEGVLS